jgi:hypothetical protein
MASRIANLDFIMAFNEAGYPVLAQVEYKENIGDILNMRYLGPFTSVHREYPM